MINTPFWHEIDFQGMLFSYIKLHSCITMKCLTSTATQHEIDLFCSWKGQTWNQQTWFCPFRKTPCHHSCRYNEVSPHIHPVTDTHSQVGKGADENTSMKEQECVFLSFFFFFFFFLNKLDKQHSPSFLHSRSCCQNDNTSLRGSKPPLEELIATARCAAPGTAVPGKAVSAQLLSTSTHQGLLPFRAVHRIIPCLSSARSVHEQKD